MWLSTAFGGSRPLVLVEDQLHVLVGAQEALHEHVGFAGADAADGLGAGLEVVLLVDDLEDAGVELELAAELLDAGLVAHQRDLGDALGGGAVGGLDRVGVVPGGDHDAAGRLTLEGLRELIEGADRRHRRSLSSSRTCTRAPVRGRRGRAGRPAQRAIISFSPG